MQSSFYVLVIQIKISKDVFDTQGWLNLIYWRNKTDEVNTNVFIQW